jgi:cell division protein FtsQ
MRRAFLLLVVLAAGVGAAVWFLRIDQVTVVGAKSLSARTIVEASGLVPGERILWERLTVAERRIEEIPAVRDAIAERSLPSTVVLRVIEREPIARLDRARDLVVDAEGVVFAAGQRDVKAVLYGWKGKARQGSVIDGASRTALEAVEDFPHALVERARKLRVGGSFTLTLLGGTEIRFGVLRDLDAKADVAAAILAAERGRKLAYIDVRSPTVPVSRERTPSPTTPAPAPASPAPAPQATPTAR